MFRVPYTRVCADGTHVHSEFKMTRAKWAGMKGGKAEQLDAFLRTKVQAKGYFKSWQRFGPWSFDSVYDGGGDGEDVSTADVVSPKQLLYVWAYTKGSTPHPHALCLDTSSPSSTPLLPHDDVLLLLVQDTTNGTNDTDPSGHAASALGGEIDLESCAPISDDHVQEWKCCVTPTGAESPIIEQPTAPEKTAASSASRRSSKKARSGYAKKGSSASVDKRSNPRVDQTHAHSVAAKHTAKTKHNTLHECGPPDGVYDDPMDSGAESDDDALGSDPLSGMPHSRQSHRSVRRGPRATRSDVACNQHNDDGDSVAGDGENELADDDADEGDPEDDGEEDDAEEEEDGEVEEDDEADDDDVADLEGLVSTMSMADDDEDDGAFSDDPTEDTEVEAFTYEDYVCEKSGLPLDARSELPSDMRLRPTTGMAMPAKPVSRANVAMMAFGAASTAPQPTKTNGKASAKHSKSGTPGVLSSALRMQCTESGERLRLRVKHRVAKHLRQAGCDVTRVPTMALNVERSIFNASIHKAHWIGVSRSWCNPVFADVYMQRAKSIFSNLDPGTYVDPVCNNGPHAPLSAHKSLADRLCAGDLASHTVGFLKPIDLCPDRWSAAAAAHAKKQAPYMPTEFNTMHRCGKCGARKTTVYEMQTRSADEPMTLFITCHNCKNHWRK